LKQKQFIKTRIIIAIAVFAVIVLIILGLPGNGFDPAEQILDPVPPDALPGQLLAMNGSGQTGWVYSAVNNGKVLVVVEVLGGRTARPQPVFIHSGTCSSLDVARFQLPDVENGRSESASSISAHDLLNMGQLSIILVNPDKKSQATSCANLTELLN
jgi:hypothetical protein